MSRDAVTRLVLAAAFALPLAAPVLAHSATPTPGNLQELDDSYDSNQTGGADWNYNYDFDGTFSTPDLNNPLHRVLTLTGVDWTDNLFFYNNASVDKIINYLTGSWGWTTTGTSPAYGVLNDAPNHPNYIDGRNGAKDRAAACSEDTHGRFYGGPDGHMYNTKFGYYVFATSHRDHDELCPGSSAWFGESEGAEHVIASQFAPTNPVYEDYAWLHNMESGCDNDRTQASGGGDCGHSWENNGLATYINLK